MQRQPILSHVANTVNIRHESDVELFVGSQALRIVETRMVSQVTLLSKSLHPEMPIVERLAICISSLIFEVTNQNDSPPIPQAAHCICMLVFCWLSSASEKSETLQLQVARVIQTGASWHLS